ncbi:MAG: endonuclease/exonuclease/phosphatase family protein [Bacteroidales bacterium]|nr:endonuclease/exonuclease/phosphatase family protein [Bacteroidales bacterium]
MKRILTTFIIIQFMSYNLYSQSLDDLSFGTDDTFEVITWNIEWFPKNGQTTINYVSQIIQNLDADILAIQEVDDTIQFRQMIDNLNGFDTYFESSWFAGLAYVYKTNSIIINDIYEIYTSSQYWSPFPRSPMVMELSFNEQDYIVINNHYKCCGDGYLDLNNEDDEETRRYIASTLLKEYIDTYFPNEKVLVVGDLNDVLTDNTSNNVFQMFIDDPDNYEFADMGIAEGTSSDWSYPSWPSHLDHILITNELFNELEQNESDIMTIRIDDYLSGGWTTYDNNISDHRPVGIKLVPENSSAIVSNTNYETELTIFPNPLKFQANIFISGVSDNSCIDIYDINGKIVESIEILEGQRSIFWDASGLSEGIYFAKLVSAKVVLSTKKLVLIH